MQSYYFSLTIPNNSETFFCSNKKWLPIHIESHHNTNTKFSYQNITVVAFCKLIGCRPRAVSLASARHS